MQKGDDLTVQISTKVKIQHFENFKELQDKVENIAKKSTTKITTQITTEKRVHKESRIRSMKQQ